MSNVLIVDDHPPSRQFLTTLMSYAGHHVTEAADGVEAMAMARLNRPDLIITDIHMPNMDGRQLVHALRTEPEFNAVPVIFYTATFREYQAREMAETCGVKLVITKPSDPEVILRNVQDVLGDCSRPIPASADETPVTTVHAASLQLSAVIELGMQMVREHSVVPLLTLFCRGIRSIIGAHSATVSLVDAAGSEPQFFGDPLPPVPNAGSHLSLPIATAERLYGWVYLSGIPGNIPFSVEIERLANTLAAQLTMAYENLLFHEEIGKSEALLRQSEAKYRACITNASCGICRTDRNGRLLVANPALVQMLGYHSEEEILDARDLPLQMLIRANAGNQTIGPVGISVANNAVEDILLRVTGRAASTDEGFEGFDLVVEDITQRRDMEEQIRQSQKLDAVGRLAGGIAHDFNNLLTIILGYSKMAMEECGPDSRLHRNMLEIKKAGERAASLTRQLLAFSRRAVVQPTVIDLNGIVTQTENMLRRLLGEDIQIEVKRQPNLSHIKADAGQIEQILLNLAVNARDAMPCGGRLAITTADRGNFVTLEVEDSGCGMPPEVLAKIFDPFFTTKETGTGIGLSTVYGIVHQNSGEVEVRSVVGCGTAFTIYLPKVEVLPSAPSLVPQLKAPEGSETILLVEDEQMVRDLTVMTLQSLGYRVIASCSGEEALRVSAGFKGEIDLLLTDVVMPKMSGRELRDRLQAKRSAMKVLFMSGYLDDAVVRQGIRESEVAFIQKPFLPDDLGRKVREVLTAERFDSEASSVGAGQ